MTRPKFAPIEQVRAVLDVPRPGRKVSLPVYDCDQCGACCRYLLIEVEHYDALREPRIQQEASLLNGRGEVPFDEAAWGMNEKAGDGSFPCRFLGADNRCGIYQTRPHVCVMTPAGGEKCQQARRCAGLPPLLPSTRGATPMDKWVREQNGEDE